MTLRQYAAKINEAAKKQPNALVIYSKDEEGNWFERLSFGPTLGHFNDHEFTSETGCKAEAEDSGGKPLKINAVCVN
jgi:hypothetical protein